MAADENGYADGPSGPAVADPDEYNQTQRLRSINQTRKDVKESIKESMLWLVSDEGFDEHDRQQFVRAAVYSYLTDIEWLMVEAGESDLLQQRDLGEVVIEPPEELVALADDTDQGYPRVIGSQSLEPFTHEIRGIQGYLTAPEIFESTWSLQVDRRHSEPQPLTRAKRTHMPIHISKNAFRVANGFLSRAGVDIDLEDEQHRAIVNEDLMEEIEEWRQDNV